MTIRDLSYRSSPFTHLCFLVSEALKGPAPAVPPSNEPAETGPQRSGGWLGRLDRWFWKQQQKDREAYLAQSHDLADLERRLREIDRQIAPRYY